jgi:D-glycero-alpha-D-manno-heptose-7-phosphate kinase
MSTLTTRSRAPLRLGLAGGGTDLSPFSEEFGGAVFNCTIDRYAYAFIAPRTDGRVVFDAKDLKKKEVFEGPAGVPRSELDLHRGVYLRMIRDYHGGKALPLTITTTVDAPMGSGLGSSSALVVALVDAFRVLLDAPLGPYDVARLAYEIERVDLKLTGGKQDQYAAAFGGANFIEFLTDGRVVVNPLRVAHWIRNEFEASLVVAFSGRSRSSSEVVEQQTSQMVAKSRDALNALHQLKADAAEMKNLLLRGHIRQMAELLNHSWEAKKRTASAVSNASIDELYMLARASGALGGKVSGAGGGGFMMLICRPEDRLSLIEALNKAGAAAEPVKLSEAGCEAWQAPS